MGFLRIFFVKRNIIKISLLFGSLVCESLLKIFDISGNLADILSSVVINSRKILKYPLTILERALIKCFNDSLLFTQDLLGYLSFFCENYKQLCLRKSLVDFNSNITQKPKTLDLKSNSLIKTLFENFNLLNNYAKSTDNYFSYFFEIEDAPVSEEDGFDEKEPSNSKASLESEEDIGDTKLKAFSSHRRDEGPNGIAMDTENVSSAHSAETTKRKPDEEYVHKLKRRKNNSQMSGQADDASTKNDPQEESGSEDVIFLGVNPHSEICLSEKSEQPDILSLLSVYRFGASINTENESLVNLQQVQSVHSSKSSENLTKSYNFKDFFENEKVLIMNKKELYSLDTEEDEIQEEENSSIDEFLRHETDESNPETVIEFKKLNRLPSNEIWKNVADEIKKLKKQIERKEGRSELIENAENFSSDVFPLISKNSEQKAGASNESCKTYEIENRLNLEHEFFCVSDKDNKEQRQVREENHELITNSCPEPKTSSASILSKRNEISNAIRSINTKKENILNLEQEQLKLLFASYFKNRRMEMDNSGEISGGLVDQEMHPYSTTSLDDSGIAFTADAHGSEYNSISSMSNLQQDFTTKCDLNGNTQLPYISSILDSPVSEKECPVFRKETDQNLTIANDHVKNFPSIRNNSQDFGNLDIAKSELHSNFSQSNVFQLPLPVFVESEKSHIIYDTELPSEIMSPDVAQNNRIDGESNASFARETCLISQNHPLASRIGIDDFEVGESSSTEKDPPLKGSSDYKPYPGQVSDLKKVKKDARYQKRFYRSPPQDEQSHMSETSSSTDQPSGTRNESIE